MSDDGREQRYAGDYFASFTLFKAEADVRAQPIKTWEGLRKPFEFDRDEFERWLADEFDVRARQYMDYSMTKNPYFFYQLVDRRRINPQVPNEIELAASENKTLIYFSSLSLFLYDFVSKLQARFPDNSPIYVSIGYDLHIMRIDAGSDKWDVLEEIHNHDQIVETRSWLLPGGHI